jgi:DHA2 family multidrug resistance protein
VTGGWSFDTVQGLARIAREIARQATMIGYLNAFTMYTVASGLAVVFALLARGRKAA